MGGGILGFEVVYHITDSKLTHVVLVLCILKLQFIVNLQLGLIQFRRKVFLYGLCSWWVGVLSFGPGLSFFFEDCPVTGDSFEELTLSDKI